MREKIRQTIRRFAAGILVLLCLCAAGAGTGRAEETNGVTLRLKYLSYLYPDGKYWNHQVGSPATDKGAWKYQSSVTDHPCSAHGISVGQGGYTCNYFDDGFQCYGFANKLFYEVFGEYCSQCRRYYDVNEIRPGDHVRCGNSMGGLHSVMVVSRDGDIITVAEANVGGTCLIRWGREIDIRELDMKWGVHAKNRAAVEASPFEHEHIAEIDKGRKATCTQDGLTDGSHCGICDLVLQEQQVIQAKGHWGEWEYVTTIYRPDREIETWLQKCTVCGTYTYRKAMTYYDWTPGDVNGNGTADGRDVIRLMNWLAGDEVEIDEKNADLNQDGEVNEKDLLMLVRCLGGEVKWPE